MSFKVVIDSCGELTDEMKASGCFETASLMIQVDDHNIVDDATFDQADFLRRVAASPTVRNPPALPRRPIGLLLTVTRTMCLQSPYPQNSAVPTTAPFWE